jgi:hypothetical protein
MVLDAISSGLQEEKEGKLERRPWWSVCVSRRKKGRKTLSLVFKHLAKRCKKQGEPMKCPQAHNQRPETLPTRLRFSDTAGTEQQSEVSNS